MTTARVAESEYAVDLKSTGAQPSVGSTPTSRTIKTGKNVVKQVRHSVRDWLHSTHREWFDSPSIRWLIESKTWISVTRYTWSPITMNIRDWLESYVHALPPSQGKEE